MVELCWRVSPLIILEHILEKYCVLTYVATVFGTEFLVLDVLVMVNSPWLSDNEPCTAARRWHRAVCLSWRWKDIFRETAIEVVVWHSLKQKETALLIWWHVVVHKNWNCAWWWYISGVTRYYPTLPLSEGFTRCLLGTSKLSPSPESCDPTGKTNLTDRYWSACFRLYYQSYLGR